MDISIFSNIPWYDLIWIILGSLFIIVGLIGCLLPFVPGPPLSFFGLLMLQLTEKSPFSVGFMILLASITIIITTIDYILPIWWSKRYGAGKYGVWGSSIGLILGFFIIPPIGIFIMPFLGALIGEIISGKKGIFAVKSSFGVFVGFLFGTFAKLTLSGYMLFVFFNNL